MKEQNAERVLILNGVIAEDTWFDDEVTPEEFKKELNSGTGPITVWINSPGGDCVAAAQIYNMLISYKGDVTVKIDGLAASAASVIAMAGNKVLMSPVSMLMIHNPSTLAIGDRNEMGKAIEMLDAVKDSIMNAYEMKTKMSRDELSKLMDNETWLDAKKAKELKFCDEIFTRDETSDAFFNETKNSVMFQKAVVEKNLTNKLKDKYLIKIPEANIETKLENEVTPEPSVNAKERLGIIKQFL